MSDSYSPTAGALTVPSYRMQRTLDLVVAMPLLTITAVPLLFVMAAARITTGASAIYKQERDGLDGKPFTIYKIRGMTEKRDARGKLLPPAQRLTKFGVWLRRRGIDELPQFWNVIKGDMSLVGPRPDLVGAGQGVPNYYLRHRVRPGMTGLAKVNEKPNQPLIIDDILRHDLTYIASRGLRRDITILFQTAAIVLRGKNNPLKPMRQDHSIAVRREFAS